MIGGRLHSSWLSNSTSIKLSEGGGGGGGWVRGDEERKRSLTPLI